MKKILIGALISISLAMTGCMNAQKASGCTNDVNDSEHVITDQQENDTQEDQIAETNNDEKVIVEDNNKSKQEEEKQKLPTPTKENQSQSYDPAVDDDPIDKSTLQNDMKILCDEINGLIAVIDEQMNTVNKYGIGAHYQSYTTQAAITIRDYNLVKPVDYECQKVYECLVNAQKCAASSFSNMYMWDKDMSNRQYLESPKELNDKAVYNMNTAMKMVSEIVKLRLQR